METAGGGGGAQNSSGGRCGGGVGGSGAVGDLAEVSPTWQHAAPVVAALEEASHRRGVFAARRRELTLETLDLLVQKLNLCHQMLHGGASGRGRGGGEGGGRRGVTSVCEGGCGRHLLLLLLLQLVERWAVLIQHIVC